MNIRCIITDDEPIARRGLRSYIENIDFLQITGECENAVQLKSMLEREPCDLLFLDIEMPKKSGLDFLSEVISPPKVIIVSAFEQYALKGYELDVVDYLLKPVTFERFMKSVNKVHNLLEKESDNLSDKYIFVKSNKQLKKIFITDILYVESMDNYVIIHTKQANDIVHTTLKQMQSILPDNLFLQTHRSYIVNINMIAAVENGFVSIEKYKIPIARNFRSIVLDTITLR